MPAERRALVAVAAAFVAAAAATPFVTSAAPSRAASRAGAALLLALGPAAAALAAGVDAAAAARAGTTGIVAAPFLFFLLAFGAFAAAASGPRAALVAPLAAAALAIGAVLAATPALEHWGASEKARAAGDLVLAVNPLAALAYPAFSVDWVRRPILYESSPIASLPFRYPRPLASAAGFAATGLVFEALRAAIARVRAGRP